MISRSMPVLRNRIIDVSLLTVAVVLALLVLLPVYGTSAALLPIVGGAGLGALIVFVARARGWQPLTVTAVVVVTYLLFGGPLAAPASTVSRVVPTADTAIWLFEGVVTVWKEILTLIPPLGTGDNVLVAPYLLALVGSVGAGMLATAGAVVGPSVAFPEHTDQVPGTGLSGMGTRASKTRTIIAGLIPVAILVLAILLGTVDAPFAVVVGIALALLLVPWTSWRLRRWQPRRYLTLALMAAVGLGGGVFGAPLVAGDAPRHVLRNEIVPPFDPKDQVSPLAGYRKFIKEFEETDLVTVRGLPEGGLVRLATMDAFDGVVWNVADSGMAEGSGAFRRVGEVIPTSVRGQEAQVQVEVQELTGIWLPTVGYSTQVEFLGRRSRAQTKAFRYNDETGTAVLPGGIVAGDRYSLDVVVPQIPDDDTLAQADVASIQLPAPQAVPDSVVAEAADIASSATTPAFVARALEQALADEGWFSHGIVDAGDSPSMSGHGASRVNELLTGPLMVGDSEQYASAMALMARELGLPSRVVMGFVPSEEQQGTDEVTFTGGQIEAWVEVAYAGHGWVPYFPTPPSTRTPNEDQTEDESKPQPQVIQPPPPPEESVTPPREDTEQPEVDSAEEDTDDGVNLGRIILLTAAIAFPILLLVLPPLLIIAAKTRRRKRRRHAPTTLARVTGGWDEVVDAAHDRRFPPDVQATRRETGRVLEATFPGTNLGKVAARADAAVFGPGQPSARDSQAMWQDVDGSLKIIKKRGSFWQRLRGNLSRASLRSRRLARRRARRNGRRRRRS